MELEFYPEFLEASGWPPLPWLAVSMALKTVTEKRTKQPMLFKNGKRRRCCVVQFQGAAGDKAGVRAAARTLAGGMGFMRVPGTVVKGTLTAH